MKDLNFFYILRVAQTGLRNSRPCNSRPDRIKTLKTNGASIYIYLFIHLNRILTQFSK